MILDEANLLNYMYSVPHRGASFITKSGNYIWAKGLDHPGLITALKYKDEDEESIIDSRGWIRCDSGLSFSPNNLPASFIELPEKEITDKQYDSLLTWMTNCCTDDEFQISVTNGDYNAYDMDYYSPEELIKIIKYYYKQGILREDFDLQEKIVKLGNKWQVQSEKGKNMGTYDTKAEAEKRLQQVHYFKYKNEALTENIEKSFLAYCKDRNINYILNNDGITCNTWRDYIKALDLLGDMRIPFKAFNGGSKQLIIDKKYLSEDLKDSAKNIFGTTNNWKLGLYINTDGTILDGSGKAFGSDGSSRLVDHREVSDLWDNISGDDAMIAYMNEGNIRWKPEAPGFELIKEPTEAQYNTLEKLIPYFKDTYYVDISNNFGENIWSREYERFDSPINDIKKYFRLNEGSNKIAGSKILKLFKDFRDNIFTLSEPEVLELFKEAIGDITLKAPMFITSNGTILNASVINKNIQDVCHNDIMRNKFMKDNNLARDQIKLTDKQQDKYIDLGFDISDYMIDNLNWVKLNSGTLSDDGEPYIVLPKHSISGQQHTILKDFFWTLLEAGKKYVEVNANDGTAIKYYFNECDPEYIMDRIDYYYSQTGRLLEDTRTALINKSRNVDVYKDQSHGKNRWERKKYSKVANAVKEYNQIDMNDFFKRDILTVKVPVQGETDNYIVSIQMEGVLAEIAKNVKSNKNKFEFRTVIQALTKIFNTGNLKVNCTCKDFLYNYKHNLIVNRNEIDGSDKDPGPGKTGRTAQMHSQGCKHVLNVLNNLDWLMKIASVISNYTHYAEEHMQKPFLKLIFPKIYGIPADEMVEQDLIDDEKFLDSSKGLIDAINAYGAKRGLIQKGTNKNPVAEKERQKNKALETK